MSVRRIRVLDAWQHDPTIREEYRRERIENLRDHLKNRGIMVVTMWSNRDGDKHDLIVITTGDGRLPRKITYDVASALGWDLYDRDGQNVIRFGGAQVSPADSLRQALGLALFDDAMAIGLDR